MALSRVAKLELQAAGVSAGGIQQQQLAVGGGAPPSAVFQTIKQHEAQAAASAPAGITKMTDSDSRDDLNSYFDSFSAPDTPKLASAPAAAAAPLAKAVPDAAAGSVLPAPSHDSLLEERLGEQDAVIKELKREVKSFEVSLQQKQEQQDSAKAEQQAQKKAMADSRAKLAATQQVEGSAAFAMQQQQQQQQQQAVAQQQAATQQVAQQQKAMSSQAALERAIGEAVLGHSSMQGATAKLAKLLEPKSPSKAVRSSYGQRVKRNAFGMPVITSADQAKLPGVNVAEWADPRVEREVASSVWRREHPMNSMEGGSQLASFAVPPPAAAPADCPICAFNSDCSINLKARGFHRASGLSDNMPAYHGAVTPYGGGGAHISSLHATVGGVPVNEPLWDKLKLADRAHVQELALDSVEGGQQLASFAPPPAAAPPPPPPPMLCECPKCKLGEEQVGFGDELHGKQALEDPELLETIDDELMRLDPAYALRRVDGVAGQTPAGQLAGTLTPGGKANPLSDFTDGPPYSGTEAEYVNQVGASSSAPVRSGVLCRTCARGGAETAKTRGEMSLPRPRPRIRPVPGPVCRGSSARV